MSIKVIRRKREYYQGQEIKQVCMNCTENYVEQDIVVNDTKYNQVHKLSLCPDCMNILKSELKRDI